MSISQTKNSIEIPTNKMSRVAGRISWFKDKVNKLDNSVKINYKFNNIYEWNI